MNVIMMHGYPATGKTFLSKKLENNLKEKYSVITVSTLEFRKELNLFDFNSDAQRNLVYDLLSKKVEEVINKKSHEIIIVDGNFNNRKRRERLYSVLKDAKFYIINCSVSNEETIRRRMNERQKEMHIMENKAATMDLYYLIKNSGDDFMEDEIVKKGRVNIIKFNSEKNSIEKATITKESAIQDINNKIMSIIEKK